MSINEALLSGSIKPAKLEAWAKPGGGTMVIRVPGTRCGFEDAALDLAGTGSLPNKIVLELPASAGVNANSAVPRTTSLLFFQ